MNVYCVSYDLKAPHRDYSGLYEALKKSTQWWHYLESTWLLQCTQNPAQLWNQLGAHVDKNDLLLIIEVRNNAAGWLPKDAWDWIHQRVPAA